MQNILYLCSVFWLERVKGVRMKSGSGIDNRKKEAPTTRVSALRSL